MGCSSFVIQCFLYARKTKSLMKKLLRRFNMDKVNEFLKHNFKEYRVHGELIAEKPVDLFVKMDLAFRYRHPSFITVNHVKIRRGRIIV